MLIRVENVNVYIKLLYHLGFYLSRGIKQKTKEKSLPEKIVEKFFKIMD